MEMTLGKETEGWRVTVGETYGGGRWLVRGSGAACLEHLQIVPHEFHPICIQVCRPLRPTHEVQIVHYQYIPVLLHQI